MMCYDKCPIFPTFVHILGFSSCFILLLLQEFFHVCSYDYIAIILSGDLFVIYSFCMYFPEFYHNFCIFVYSGT